MTLLPVPTNPEASATPARYTAGVPVFARYLGQSQGLLAKAHAHCAQQGTPEAALRQARLAPDMLPLGVQVEIAVNFVFRACAPAGQTTVALDGSTFLQQYALPNFFFHLSMVYALLRQQGLPLSKGDFDGWHVYSQTVQTT